MGRPTLRRPLRHTLMEHIFWLIPNRLAGRSGPTSNPWSLDELRAAGFAAVINLSETEPDFPAFAQAGVDVAWFPLPNSYPADLVAEEGCLRDLPKAHEFLRVRWDAGQPVLVHCAWGRDRTGLLLAYHLVQSQGLSPEAAIAAVKQVRPKALTALGWEEMAVRIFRQLNGSSAPAQP